MILTMNSNTKRKADTLGVCGGNGVTLLPFQDRLIANLEPRVLFNTPGNIQWKMNFKETPFFRDYRECKRSVDKDDVKIIIGAPDCGHSSALTYAKMKKLNNPKENESLNTFMKAVKYFQPEIFIMENLPKMLDTITKEEWEKSLGGYKFIFINTSVISFGNSQKTRTRLVLIGTKNYSKRFRKIFNNIYKVAKPRLSKKITDEFIELRKSGKISGCEREPMDHLIGMTYKGVKKIPVSKVEMLWRTKFKKNYQWFVPGSKMGTIPGVYRNLAKKYPRTARKECRQYNYLGEIITPRELALIQGVPNSFKIFYDPQRPTFSLNKARVTITKSPPYEIPLWFRKQLDKYEQHDTDKNRQNILGKDSKTSSKNKKSGGDGLSKGLRKVKRKGNGKNSLGLKNKRRAGDVILSGKNKAR